MDKIDNEALSEQVELLQVLMDNNPSLIFLKDECGKYVYLNKTYERQFVGSSNWQGKTDFDFWSKESAEMFRTNDLAVLETGQVTQYLEDSIDMSNTRYCWLNYKFPYIDSKDRRYTGGIGIDITQRILAEEALRKAEESLRVSEEKYRSLFANMSEGFSLFEVIYDDQGSPSNFLFLEVNKAYEEYTGLKSADLIGKTILEVAQPAEPMWIEVMRRVALSEESLRAQGYKESTKKYFEAIIFSPQKDRVAVLFKDITEQKQMEIDRVNKERMLRTVIENSRDGIYMVDLKTGHYVFMSPNHVELTGFTLEEINRLSAVEAYDRTHPEDREVLIAQQRLLAEGKDISRVVEYRWMVKSGEYRWFSDSRKLVYDAGGVPVSMVGISRDITQSKLTEEALRRQNQLNSAIIKSISDGLLLLDTDNKFTLLNQGAKDFFYQPDKILSSGDSFAHTKYYDLDDNALSVDEMVGSRALKGESIKSCRIKAVRPDKTIFLSMSGSPVYDDNGQIVAAIVCSRDISEQIKAEITNKEALENSIKMKDEFLTTITHEFKTPLNVINAALQMIEMIHGNQLPDNLNKHLHKIKKNSYRQLRLVNNLLDITRYNDDHLKMEIQNLDIVHLTEAITNSVDLYAIQKGVKLSFSSEIDHLEIALDEEKYERILLNLLSNAIKFTPKEGSIDVHVAANSNYVSVTVCDEGIGIPKSKQKLIFERFGQVDSSLSRRAEGTGIGLSLVKALTSAMNGTITVSSRMGRGSEFKIKLPITKPASKKDNARMAGSQDSRIIQAAAIEFSDHYL